MRAAAVLLALGLAAAACGGSRAPAERFGERRPGTDARETLDLAAPADPAGFYVYPAVVDSVGVRPERRAVAAGDSVAVEVLVQGALPDACSALDAVTQSQAGQFVTVELTMRQPRRGACAQAVRPFRFYVRLDRRFGAGAYVLRLNGRTVPFQIREEPPGRG